VPGFGPKKSLKLVTELQLNNPDTVIQDVLTAARSGQIDSIEGFGHKSAMDIIQRLEEYEGGIAKDVRMILPQAYDLAMHIINYLKKSSIIERVEPLGSLRRMKETIGDIDIAVASAKPDQGDIASQACDRHF
jgi:DNA polymerase (family 10)